MFLKLGALLDRTFGSKRSPTKAGAGIRSQPQSSSRARARAISEPGAPATPPRAAAATSAPSATLIFPGPHTPHTPTPTPVDMILIRAATPRRALSPAGPRRVRFSSESTLASVCTTHSKEAYDRSPIVDVPEGACAGMRASSPSKRERERARPKLEIFPPSFSSPDLSLSLSPSPGQHGARDSKRERRPSLRMQSTSRSFMAMTIEEEGPALHEALPLTRSQFERGEMRPRPKPRMRPSTDSARAICGGVVGRGCDVSFDDDEEESLGHDEEQEHARGYTDAQWLRESQIIVTEPVGESFLSLDYSDDEDIEDDLHTTMFVHGRRASARTAPQAAALRSDALFFTLQQAGTGGDSDEDVWEAYGAAQTERTRERARERRERRALLAAFPEPPTTPPGAGLGMLKHRAIAEWVKESASVSVSTVCGSAESSTLGHGARSESPSPLGWRQTSETGTAETTLELTPPRAHQRTRHEMRGGLRAPYDARALPAKSCPTLVAPGGSGGMVGREKLLPLVPYDGLPEPFRFERHPYAAPALRAGR